ncbi:hypothetical protein [Vagococcus acidifermentans]|uniref:Cell division protein FtsL n=1 Tax=Vagococcus acidifermentans TaxID=564710 RepID=A0A430AWQ0_9ENTE|nr:hypothetical protein [Vagococcus acidifermentans]RSU12473.1 hypothetical protein CBF27_05720 [Vagococcus acidifermentans]
MTNAEKHNHEQLDIPVVQPSTKEKVLTEVTPYLVPKRKLDKVSKLEKLVVALFIVTFVVLSVATVQLSTAINQEEKPITAIQQEVSADKEIIEQLEQEKNELSRKDRVNKIAEEADVKHREENIRNIR